MHVTWGWALIGLFQIVLGEQITAPKTLPLLILANQYCFKYFGLMWLDRSRLSNKRSVMCSCGSVVEHCVSSAKGCGFNSQRTHILIKKIFIAWMHCKLLWIKTSAKCTNECKCRRNLSSEMKVNSILTKNPFTRHLNEEKKSNLI